MRVHAHSELQQSHSATFGCPVALQPAGKKVTACIPAVAITAPSAPLPSFTPHRGQMCETHLRVQV